MQSSGKMKLPHVNLYCPQACILLSEKHTPFNVLADSSEINFVVAKGAVFFVRNSSCALLGR